MKLPKLETKSQPVINSLFIPGKDWGEPRSLNLDSLVYWVKRTPECIGILKRIATDIVTESHFKSLANQNTGRPSKTMHQNVIDKANLFWANNQGRNKMLSAVLDWLMTGDTYIWMGNVEETQMKEIAVRHYKSYGFDITTEDIDVKEFIDEDYNNLSTFEVIPSSMVEIVHDETKINYYLQKSKTSPGNDIKFYPDEVIHAKFMDIDGKVYGYSPMESSYIAIKTINAIQDYNYNYFANGVKLDRAWMFQGTPNQQYMDKFQEQLRKYRSVSSARGDLVIAGADKIDMKELNAVSEEMEFRKLAINAVGRLAFAFNMPADILSSVLGVDIKGTAMGSDIEDAGYNRNIIEAQKYWENMLNNQLFNKFNVEIQFERTFRQDQIRQVQFQTMATTFAEFLFKHEFPVTDEYMFDMFQIPNKYRKEGQIKREIEIEAKPFQQPMQKGGNAQRQSDSKKKQQQPQANNQPQVGS